MLARKALPALVAGVLMALATSGSAHAQSACGSFDTSTLRYTVSASGGATCPDALRVVKSFIQNHAAWREVSVDGTVAGTSYTNEGAFPGWRCAEGSGGGSCSNGAQVAAYQNAARPAPRAKSCGTVSASYPTSEGGSGNKLTFVRGLSCRAARSIARRCIVSRHVRGWTARFRDPSRVELRSRGRRIVMQGVAGGAPLCAPDD
jgi:hypothetical protein